MNSKNFSKRLLFILGAMLIIYMGAFGQPGHHHHNGRQGYYYDRGDRYYSFNRPYVSIAFGGINYRYSRGIYYRPYGSYFSVTVPPFGIRIRVLPPGYRRIYVGPREYYYYDGIYYNPYGRDEYEVIAPPLGARVPELPRGAEVTVIDDQKYYEFNGTYYKEEITQNNEIWYSVVGTNGVLNTEGTSIPDNKVSDKLDKLPANSKTVVISGQKYYVAPSGEYYQEVIDGNKVHYEIVGK
jgi:Family of unknown function (DUF6515)